MSEEHWLPEQLQQNPSVGHKAAPVVTVAAKIAATTKPLTNENRVNNVFMVISLSRLLLLKSALNQALRETI